MAKDLDEIYRGLGGRRRTRKRDADPLADRPWIVADLHMHTTWSHDCSIEVDELLDHAEAEGLGAIAITDHNVFGGALEAAEAALPKGAAAVAGPLLAGARTTPDNAYKPLLVERTLAAVLEQARRQA